MSHKSNMVDLGSEAPLIHSLLLPYVDMFQEKTISEADLIAVFILIYMIHRRPRKWCSGFAKIPISGLELSYDISPIRICQLTESVRELMNISYLSKKLKVDESVVLEQYRVVDIFNHLTFSGIKHNTDNYINHFVVKFYLRQRPVCLLHYIPTPIEVLTQQANGERVITMFLTIEELSRSHVSKLRYMTGNQEHARDPFEFLLHDIRHMEHFISPEIYYEQVGFFDAMLRINPSSVKFYFLNVLGYPKALWYELEYVLSDMNCYSTHLLRYVHAKWISSFRRKILEEKVVDEIPGSAASTTSDEHYSIDRENEEWSSIVDAIFVFDPFSSQGELSGSVSGPLSVNEKSLEERKEAMCLSTYLVAKEAVVLLNEISRRKLSDLSVEQWESIRKYFSWRGRKKLVVAH